MTCCVYWIFLSILFLLPLLFLLLGGSKETLWLIWHTLPRDLKLGRVLVGIKLRTEKMKKENVSIVSLFEKTVEKYPKRAMFKFQGHQWTFEEVNKEANEVAAYFQKLGLKKGDCVALLLENSPDLVIYWVGLAKIGVISALVNFNQRQAPLVHSITISSAKAVVCSSSLLEDAFEPVRGELGSIGDEMIFVHTGGKRRKNDENETLEYKYRQIDQETKKLQDLTFIRPKINYDDTVLYIFTSGTTGLPKAANLKNSRIISIGISFNEVLKTTCEDIIWSPLPLYHSNAGLLGVTQVLTRGCCMAFRSKFSASSFWKDIKESEATMFIYLGEICRYIYAQPITSEETQHKLRLIFGAGLKKELWKSFLTRFQIPKVLELYGSTEGNANTINLSQREGACGFFSRLFPSVFPITLVKVDPQGSLIRDAQGVCVKCKPGEPGQVVGKIIANDAISKFDGYVAKDETQKKIARDVFRKGDLAFLSGDTLVMDREGFLFFKDRTGDTFRWKGENVSTTEVEAVMFPAVGHKDVIVFGVELPHCDGRAGMAAILDDQKDLDLSLLTVVINRNLASYARPLFLRLLDQSEHYLTGTYKLKKTELVKEGFLDVPAEHLESVYYYDMKTKQYLQMDEQVKQKIVDGEIKF
ncbi:long-chain fatty acid transport protein 4-like isoform X1 [Symsagittifera roscoffensis]|uniref:long-chain fatty acid transport protein 4-like isoform X1 n=1 Tax=Symsagittifera roscoffensis TaxID=84072 RepID=UPI00307C86BC